jgi:hypothetical protein
MKKNRLIFYLIFALFHLGAFIFTVVLDNNANILFQMVGWVPAFKWVTLFGLILLIIDVVWSFIMNKESQSEKATLNHELNTLKAKLFDLQEAARTSTQRPATNQNN